jgi:anti-sigma factor RsiW
MERDEKILDYIDGLLSAEEAEQVREKITTDGEWKPRYDSFLEMNTLLNSTELLSPSTSFVDQTMARMKRKQKWKLKRRFTHSTLLSANGLAMGRINDATFYRHSTHPFFHNSATRDC